MGKLNSYANSKLKNTHLNSSKNTFLGFRHVYNYVPPTLDHLHQALATLLIASQTDGDRSLSLQLGLGTRRQGLLCHKTSLVQKRHLPRPPAGEETWARTEREQPGASSQGSNWKTKESEKEKPAT